MNKPYVPCEESESKSYVSMVTDCSIGFLDVLRCCMNCWNGLSWMDMSTDQGGEIKELWDMHAEPDIDPCYHMSNSLCPACWWEIYGDVGGGTNA